MEEIEREGAATVRDGKVSGGKRRGDRREEEVIEPGNYKSRPGGTTFPATCPRRPNDPQQKVEEIGRRREGEERKKK